MNSHSLKTFSPGEVMDSWRNLWNHLQGSCRYSILEVMDKGSNIPSSTMDEQRLPRKAMAGKTSWKTHVWKGHSLISGAWAAWAVSALGRTAKLAGGHCSQFCSPWGVLLSCSHEGICGIISIGFSPAGGSKGFWGWSHMKNCIKLQFGLV
jgi:hypothetical protein